MSLLLLKLKTLKELFPHSHYERGYAYYRNGHVRNLKIENAGEKITAKVKGKGSKIYNVSILLTGSGQRTHVRGLCTCPMVINCKHVVATLLQAMNPSDMDTTAPLQDTKVDHWLRSLNNALTANSPPADGIDETYSLCYVLNTTHHNKTDFQIELCLSRRLKSGTFGKPKKYSLTSYSHQHHLLPIDRDLLLKLEILKKKISGYSATTAFPLKDEAGEKLLLEIISTGRCHWLSTENSALIYAQTKTAELNWKTDEEGFQKLYYSIPIASFDILPIHSLWYLDNETSEVGLLETGLENHISKILLSSPNIPPEQAKEVADLLMKHQKLGNVKPPNLFKEIKIDKIKPVPCLQLSEHYLTVPSENYRQPSQIKQPMASLSFDYDGKDVAWNNKQALINIVKNDCLIRFKRDQDLEESAMNDLLSHDLCLVSDVPEIAKLNNNFTHYFTINQDPLDFSLHIIPLLRANGWHINIADNYPYQVIEETIDDWYSSIDEGSSYDWFNLELGITVRGEKINLLPVLQKLLQKLRENNHQAIPDTEKVFAQLPNGKFIALPSERIKNILNVLIELHDSESLTDEKYLRLSKLQAARLLELEAAMGAAKLRWFGGEHIRLLATKLADFKSIENISVPLQFKGELRPYQRDGLDWLQFLREYELSGILADDMGLGKTVQALAHIMVEKLSGRMVKPILVIAPTSLMFNWRMEAERFTPTLKVLVLHGPERKHAFENMLNYDLILTTYPLIVRDKEILLKHEFHFLILDEAQFIKNSKSLATQIVQQLKAKYRLCLTGTPLENHLGELWSLFHFMMPGLLGNEKKFNRLFRIPIEKQGDQERRSHLNRRIAPFLLRRTKDKVLKELPAKVEIIRHVELDGTQRDLYETIRVTMQKKVRQEIAKMGLARSHIILLDALLKLRQTCCDPRLLKIKIAEKSKSSSAKFELLMTMLVELLDEGRQILLFSQFTEMLGLIEEALHEKKIAFVKLTGQTKDRETPVQQFQNGKVSLFLISLKAGGTGLNLTAADIVIHYDPWWNPAVESQATDRAHRIGQDKTVFVYKLVAKGTVEEKILEMQVRKRALMEGLFSENANGKLKLTEKELQGLFEPLE